MSFHPSQDLTQRFSLDELLRKHGFEIYSRPKKAPALWSKKGVRGTTRLSKIYSQREALKTLPYRELMLANRARKNYLEDTFS